MINKKTLMSVALACCLFGSSANCAEVSAAPDILYVKGAYNTAAFGTRTWPGMKKNSGSNNDADINMKFAQGYLAASVGAGYHFGIVRGELDLSYSTMMEFETKEGFKDKATVGIPKYFPDTTGYEITANGMGYMSAVATAIYDIQLNDYFSPYVGVGLGVTRVSFDSTYTGYDSNYAVAYHLSPQLKAGVSVTGIASFVPYAGYKFTYAIKAKYSEVTENKTASQKNVALPNLSQMIHNFEAGVMFPVSA